MWKKNFVTLKINKNYFKLYADDISAVYRSINKKRPIIPPYEKPS
jgi:hypothetical protein